MIRTLLMLCALLFVQTYPIPGPGRKGATAGPPASGSWKLCGDTSSSSSCGTGNDPSVRDSTGNGFTGTWNGSPAGSPSGNYYSATGRTSIPYAGAFDGTSNYIAIPRIPAVTGVPFTICFWYEPPSSPSGVMVSYLMPSSSEWDGWFFSISSSVIGLSVVLHTSFLGGSSGSYIPTAWNFVCGVLASSSSQQIYINAVAATASAISADLSFNTDWRIGIGCAYILGSSPGNFSSGLINEVAIYNTALSGSQISILYSLQAANHLPDLFDRTDPVFALLK